MTPITIIIRLLGCRAGERPGRRPERAGPGTTRPDDQTRAGGLPGPEGTHRWRARVVRAFAHPLRETVVANCVPVSSDAHCVSRPARPREPLGPESRGQSQQTGSGSIRRGLWGHEVRRQTCGLRVESAGGAGRIGVVDPDWDRIGVIVAW